MDVIVSRAARLTILDETGIAFRDNHWAEDLASWLGPDRHGRGDLRYWTATDLAAGPASGSYPARGMVVVPASTAAVAGIALGLSKDLLQRAADVTLKERRPLVVVPRETPYTRSTLTNLLTLYDAGAVVLPASPAFYAGAGSVQQLVDFVAAKVLDVIGVEHDADHPLDRRARRRAVAERPAAAATDRACHDSHPMDAVDRSILDALRANARATYAELAREVGLSAPAVHERVGKLEAQGVITGYHAAVAPGGARLLDERAGRGVPVRHRR